MEIRLNKYISESGYCSRREADKYIESGNVKVNGRKVDKMGAVISTRDRVMVNGLELEPREDNVYILLNKPVGVTCTTDRSDSTNIVDFVNYPKRIFNIGRLDKDSEGLIILTNNGDIVNKVLRAGNNHEKEYEVIVNKPIGEKFVQRMAQGVPILGTVTKKCKVVQEGESSFRIILTQGLNRQIRRMCEFLGYEVVKLRRVRMMNIKLDRLPLGNWRELTDQEEMGLMALLTTSDNSEAASKGAGASKRQDVVKKTSAPKRYKNYGESRSSSKPRNDRSHGKRKK